MFDAPADAQCSEPSWQESLSAALERLPVKQQALPMRDPAPAPPAPMRDSAGRFLPGASPGPGRPKGRRNRVSGAVHRDVLRVYQQLGGAEGLLRWAQSSAENLGTFYAHVLRLGALLWLRPDVARHWDSTGDA